MDKWQMANQTESPVPTGLGRPYDIYDRAFKFAAEVIAFVGTLPRNVAGYELGKQLLRSGTSIGANLEEADGAESKRDFIHKAAIARKEARESHYWLRLCAVSEWGDGEVCRGLTRESAELPKILSAIIHNANPRSGTKE
jgi:four helix bundle protein